MSSTFPTEKITAWRAAEYQKTGAMLSPHFGTGVAIGMPDELDKVLKGLETGIAPLFARAETRDQIRKYLEGLLSVEGRMNSRRIADAVGDDHPWRTQRLLNRSRWSANKLRDTLQSIVGHRMGDPAAVLVVGRHHGIHKKAQADDTAHFGGSRHGSPAAEEPAGVFLAYVTPRGSVLVDRELYVPRDWMESPCKHHKAWVPKSRVAFQRSAELAVHMIQRAKAAGLPFSAVTAGPEFGRDPLFRTWLEPDDADTQKLTAVAEAQRVGERCLDTARLRAGLDGHEVRSCKAWYRHTTLSMVALLAFAIASGTVPGVDRLPCPATV